VKLIVNALTKSLFTTYYWFLTILNLLNESPKNAAEASKGKVDSSAKTLTN